MQTLVKQLAGQAARVTDYFGLWAIEDQRFRSMVFAAGAAGIPEHVAAHVAAGPDYGFEFFDGLAIITLHGSLMKHQSSYGGTSTVAARRAIRNAEHDERVRAILLHVDSPGGTVSGTMDLAKAVAGTTKPIQAFIEDCGCSAAYWIASQADKVFTNDTAIVGSIGTFAVLTDSSAAAEKAGLVVHVVRAGDLKGMGIPGTEITAEQLAELQGVVDAVNGFFVVAVARGRQLGKRAVEKLADGAVYVGKAAARAKLTDGVKSLDDVIAALTGPGPADARSQTTTSTSGPTATAAKPSAKPTIVSRPPASSPRGASTLPVKEQPVMSAIERFDNAVAAEMQINGGKKPQAIRTVVVGDKELHAEFLEEQRQRARQPAATSSRGASATAVDPSAIARFDNAVTEQMQINGGKKP